MVPIDFHPEAAAELEESFDWYANRSPRAARDFAFAVDAAIEKISADPRRFPKVDQRHQSCRVVSSGFRFSSCFGDMLTGCTSLPSCMRNAVQVTGNRASNDSRYPTADSVGGAPRFHTRRDCRERAAL